MVLDFRRGVIASRLNKFCQLACVSFIFISHVLVAKQLRAVRRSENQGGGATNNVMGIICLPGLDRVTYLPKSGDDRTEVPGVPNF